MSELSELLDFLRNRAATGQRASLSQARLLDIIAALERAARLEAALHDVTKSAHRILRHGHDFWERHQHSPDSDEMSAALTDLHMALRRNGLDAVLAEEEK